jgi:hypothetical protein
MTPADSTLGVITMSNHLDTIIPFGKYKGQPVEVLAADTQYLDWIRKAIWCDRTNVYRAFIPKLAETYPTLDQNGFGMAERMWRERNSNFKPDPFTDHEESAFWTSVEYLRTLTRTKIYTKYAPLSYGLKHDAENYSRRKYPQQNGYVSNGTLIAALIFLGIPFKPSGDRGLDWEINVIARLSHVGRMR